LVGVALIAPAPNGVVTPGIGGGGGGREAGR
jgi:hypothetical protein